MTVRIKSATCNHLLGEPCEVCEAGWQEPPNGGPTVRTFREGWYEHIALDPIYISSAQQLRDECRKHEVHSYQVEDGNLWRTKSGKWQ